MQETGNELQLFKAEFFRALAHPIRIRILEILSIGDRSVQELQDTLQLEQPLVSQQLAVLRGKNIVIARNSARRLSMQFGIRWWAIS